MIVAAKTSISEFEHPRYDVLEHLGCVPGGQLFQVHDRLRGENVALRTLPATHVEDSALLRFQGIVRALGRIDHPFVSRVRDLGRAGTFVFYTHELAADVRPVHELALQDEPTLIQCLASLADALGALHAAGLVHGSAIPEHLRIMARDGRPYGAWITDAGATVLLPGRELGLKSRYVAPEVRAGVEPTPASDLYGLGVVLLEALGGRGAMARLARGADRPFVSSARGFTPDLVDLLDGLVAQNPASRPASAVEVLNLIRDPGWAYPRRALTVDQLVSPLLVGREQVLGDLEWLIRDSAGHAAEVIGAAGMGRSRLLFELGQRAVSRGWAVVNFTSAHAREGGKALVRDARLAMGLDGAEASPAADSSSSPAGPSSLPAGPSPVPRWTAGGRRTDGPESDSRRHADLARAVVGAVAEAGARLLILVDDADRLPPDAPATLRYLATETGDLPIVVIAAGEHPVGLPDALTVELTGLGERELRRLVAPLISEAVNPEAIISALGRASGGNPLWVRLLVSSWLESGRIRLVQGRPFFDEKNPAEVPAPIGGVIRALVATLEPIARDLIEAMAVWGRTLPDWLRDHVLSGRPMPTLSGVLVAVDESGSLRLSSDAIGTCVLERLNDDRLRFWHSTILEAVTGRELEPGVRAVHLLGAGRTSDAIVELISAARQAEAFLDHRQALAHYRLIMANLDGLAGGAIDRAALALDAARVAVQAGDLAWARDVLGSIELSRETGAATDPEFRFEFLLVRAHVLREQRLADEAARVYDQARALAEHEESLSDEVVRVDLEEAANDFFARRAQAGEDRLRPVIARLEEKGATGLLATALNRLATIRGQLGDPGEAVSLALRAAELARGLGDHLLAARAFNNLGVLYLRVSDPSRALWALDRAREQLAIVPHEGLAAAELVHRGDILMSLGRFDEAEKALLHARAIRLRSGPRGRVPAVLIHLGRARRHGGRLEQAEDCYREAIALAEEFELPEVHTARANLGELRMHQGELKEAERFIRLGLADPQKSHVALGLANLGCLLRRQGRLGEAISVLEESEASLARDLPGKRPLAVIEASRVHLDGGDSAAAELRLAEIEIGAEHFTAEMQAEFHLASGLVRAHVGEDPRGHFARAIDAARVFGDPTLLAEILIESMGALLARESGDLEWLRDRLTELENAAARTDARPVLAEYRRLRAEVAAVMGRPSASAELAQRFATNVLELGTGSVDTLLAQLVSQIDGADGALVLALRLAPDGKLRVAPVPGASAESEGPVRPYRVAAKAFDRQLFRRALAATGGSVPQAARLLRLPESTFRYRAGKLGLLKRGGR